MDPQDVLKEFVYLQSSSSSSDEESGSGRLTDSRKRQRTNKAGSMEPSLTVQVTKVMWTDSEDIYVHQNLSRSP
eukprot:485517-Hanusia_phi.AAC.1